MEAKQTLPISRGGGEKKEERLEVGSEVFVKNFSTGKTWPPRTITESSGLKSFIVETIYFDVISILFAYVTLP